MILQGFVRAEGVDYSAADAAIATDEAAGADTAQDGPGESVGDVGSAALARDTETLNIISAADQAGANDLVADWGAPGSESFATNWAHAKHAYETLASPALDRVLDDYGLGDDPLILRVPIIRLGE